MTSRKLETVHRKVVVGDLFSDLQHSNCRCRGLIRFYLILDSDHFNLQVVVICVPISLFFAKPYQTRDWRANVLDCEFFIPVSSSIVVFTSCCNFLMCFLECIGTSSFLSDLECECTLCNFNACFCVIVFEQ